MAIYLSERSRENIDSCHIDIQKVFYAVAEDGVMDFSVICGHRGEKAQNAAYKSGNSNAKWGESEHNKMPSEAVDAVPYPIDWHDLDRFRKFADLVLNKAKELGIELYWGGNWKSFKDYPHYSLTNR